MEEDIAHYKTYLREMATVYVNTLRAKNLGGSNVCLL